MEELKEVIDSSYVPYFEGIGQIEVGAIVAGIIAGIMAGVIVFAAFASVEKYPDRAETLISCFLGFAFGVFIFWAITHMETRKLIPENWITDVAEPYFENLEVQNETIQITSAKKIDGSNEYIVEFTMKNEDGLTFLKEVTAEIVEEDITHSKYEYKKILMDIPNYKEAGNYEEVIKIPVGTVLTD